MIYSEASPLYTNSCPITPNKLEAQITNLNNLGFYGAKRKKNGFRSFLIHFCLYTHKNKEI